MVMGRQLFASLRFLPGFGMRIVRISLHSIVGNRSLSRCYTGRLSTALPHWLLHRLFQVLIWAIFSSLLSIVLGGLERNRMPHAGSPDLWRRRTVVTDMADCIEGHSAGTSNCSPGAARARTLQV